MQDSKSKKLEVGHLADITGVVITDVDGDNVTVDLGGGHCVTLNNNQVKESLATTGIKAPVKEATDAPKSIDRDVMEVSASEVGLLDDELKGI